MNPQFDQSPGLHLPQPGTGSNQSGYNPAFFNAPPQPLGQQPGQPFAPAVGQNVPPQVQTPPTPAQAATQVAGDDIGGVVDDEWVEKARDITLRYRSDPYMQCKELSALKSQYVKARYNKDVKVSDAP